MWIEAAIQGRSGLPWIDAMVNSPLDVDKLDYVFRDCRFLDQSIHISLKQENRYRWIDNLFKHTRILPSGLIALAGEAGEQARDLIEERRWLYKHQYYQPGYRALERLASAVVLQWLLHFVADDIAHSNWHGSLISSLRKTIGDTGARKGFVARELLWKELRDAQRQETTGEPGLLLKLANDVANLNPTRGVPVGGHVRAWASRCRDIFTQVLGRDWRSADKDHLTLLQFLVHKVGITCSESVYVSFYDLEAVRAVVRELETLRPFRAMFDIAVFPRMLSYPSRRRFKWHGKTVLAECFAVSHRDPDRWGAATGRWIPLSESAFAERDEIRWARVTAVSAEPCDPEVSHAMDRFRAFCRQKGITLADVDPDEAVA